MKAIFFLQSLLYLSSFSFGQNPSKQKSDTLLDVSKKITNNFSKLILTQLPRPNSETFTFEQAEKRKKEIFELGISKKYFNWKNPTSGGAVHINQKDEIEIYQFTFGIYIGRTDKSVDYVSAAKDTFIVLKDIKDLLYFVGGIGEGNPSSVLITSELNIAKSKSFKLLLQELWQPSIQIYYYKRRKIE